MALIHLHFFSPVLGKQSTLYAVVPDAGRGPFPVYYLLHGYSDDASAWLRQSRIESYARELPLIVVMPDGYKGFYCDHVQGPAYGRYILEDVIGGVERLLPAQRKRSGRCIGGLSMGGYGALRLALSRPDLFCSVNSHSGGQSRAGRTERFLKGSEKYYAFGPRGMRGENDLYALASGLKRSRAPRPAVRIDCGTEDRYLNYSREFHEHLESLQIVHEYAEYPGAHNWDYWDQHVQTALKFHCGALRIRAAR